MDKLTDYIGYYEDIVPDMLSKQLMWYSFDFKPSKFANHYGDMTKERSEERVRMDDVWISAESSFHKKIDECFDKVIEKYNHPHLNIERKTYFRFHRYSGTGYMSEHVDSIHHSHKQKYGFPHCTALLFLNDDYEVIYMHLARGADKAHNYYNKPNRMLLPDWIKFVNNVILSES